MYNFVTSVIFLTLINAATSRTIVVDGEKTSLGALCDDNVNNDVIQLNGTMVHNLTKHCMFDNKVNITLQGLPGYAVINCLRNGSLSFINSSFINLTNVTITNCGTTNITSGQDILPPAFKKQMIAVLFMCCWNVRMTNVNMTDNLGINLVGLSVFGISVLENVVIQNVTILEDHNLTSSAAVFEFRDDLNCTQPSELPSNNSLHNNSLNITNSLFLNNNNTVPEYILEYFNSYIISLKTSYDHTIPVLAPGLSIGFINNNNSNFSVLVSNTKFIGNHGRFGGGMFIAFANPVKGYNMRIDGCTFQDNSVDKKYIQTSNGAAIIAMSFFYQSVHHGESSLNQIIHSGKNRSHGIDPLIIRNSNFANNSAVIGTCIYMYLFVNGQSVVITLENLIFNSNKGDVATAVYAEDHLLYESTSTVCVTMTNITAKNNQLVHATSPNSKPLSDVNGLFVFFNVKNVQLNGNSNCFTNNIPGVMGFSSTDVIFNGGFHFINNTSPNDGGAVYLTTGSTMVINNNSFICFENNRADKTGGAIYSDSSGGIAVLAAVCPIQFNISKKSNMNISVVFSNNSASNGGNSIFASQLYPCGWFPKYGSLSYNESVKDLYNKKFNFSYDVCNCSNNCSGNSSHNMTHTAPHELCNDRSDCFNISNREITSMAHSVCFCNNTSTNICYRSHRISVHSGKEATFCVMVVDSKNSPLYSNVHFLLSNNYTVNRNKVPIYPNGTVVTATFTGRPNSTVNAMLRPSVPLYTKAVNLTVYFEDCSVGFKPGNDSCLCETVLQDKGFCDESHGLIIPPGGWMGNNGQSNTLYFNSYCDVANCKYNSSVIRFSETEGGTSVCQKHRDGILCGKCIEGYSVVFGSQDCRHCHNYALVSLLVTVIVGIIVVFLLSLLKLTVDKGIINGAIFFANIVYINHNLLYIVDIKVLPGIFDLINLDAPTGICFYQGMTALAKYTLELIYPIYLWLLVLLVVLFIRMFPRVSNFIQSPPQLLATLIYLSYSKLLLVINYMVKGITVSKLQSSEVHTSIHWYQDPNVEYGDARHVVMVIVSLLLFFVVLLPFAVILTFPNYCLGFRCMFRFKPIIDSYTAPYKDKWGFWLGIHLWILIAFYVLFTMQQFYGNPRDLFLIILLFIIPLTGVQLYCKPYKSRWVNFLDTLFLVNLIISGCVILWVSKDGIGLTTNVVYFKLVVYFCLAVAALEIFVILLYHVMMVTSSGQRLIMMIQQLLCCKKDSMALDTFSERTHSHRSPKLSYSDEDQPLLNGDMPPRFRESFLEYDNLVSPRSLS